MHPERGAHRYSGRMRLVSQTKKPRLAGALPGIKVSGFPVRPNWMGFNYSGRSLSGRISGCRSWTKGSSTRLRSFSLSDPTHIPQREILHHELFFATGKHCTAGAYCFTIGSFRVSCEFDDVIMGAAGHAPEKRSDLCPVTRCIAFQHHGLPVVISAGPLCGPSRGKKRALLPKKNPDQRGADRGR
jgi:hypothetical protein